MKASLCEASRLASRITPHAPTYMLWAKAMIRRTLLRLTPVAALLLLPVAAEAYSLTQSPTAPLVNGSGNVANASAVATLTGGATTTVYISGFQVTGSGSTAALPVACTVAGLLGGSQIYTYTFAAGVLVGNTPLIVAYDPPIPASAINTPISVTCAAGGAGNTRNSVVAYGFHL